MLIEEAALQSGAGGVLSHRERLVQPLEVQLRSPILFHHIMGHQHQAQSYREKNRGASTVRGGVPAAEDGWAGLVGHSGKLHTLGNSHLKQTPFFSAKALAPRCARGVSWEVHWSSPRPVPH